MNSNYVRGASVTASASQDEIRSMLAGSGATGVRCTWEDGRAAIAFSSGACRFRIALALPRGAGDPLQPPSSIGHGAKTAQEGARQRWRALSQLIRAKLDAVAAGIVTFDQEFQGYALASPGDAPSRGAAGGHGQDGPETAMSSPTAQPGTGHRGAGDE